MTMTVRPDIAGSKTPTNFEISDLTVGGGRPCRDSTGAGLRRAGLTVNVNDLNVETLATLKAGKLPFIEHGAAPLLTKALAEGRLIFTSAPAAISSGGPVIVTIGTPVDEFLNPEQGAVRSASMICCPSSTMVSLLVLRSTVYPRHDDWLDRLSQRTSAANSGRLLPRTRGPRLRHRGVEGDAANRQRHVAGGRGQGGRALRPHRAGIVL